ncbi:hypothetical protein [Agrobacterium tumefaciens]|uniref:hypothetical protein n=1 Tax=Agrobacterium tumefaciens TaxID=358 RepID=UPI003B9EE04E
MMIKSIVNDCSNDPFPVDIEAELAAGTIYNPAESDVLYEEGIIQPKEPVDIPRKRRSRQRK